MLRRIAAATTPRTPFVVMRADDVREVIGGLPGAGIRVWLDGGWGVGALLGEQTRAHDDLDLVIGAPKLARAQHALGGRRFGVTEDDLPTRLVLRDRADRRIDPHPVAFEGDGSGIQTLQDGAPWRYPADGFSGVGSIAGRPVSCLTPEAQVLCHLGYEPDETDRRDMAVLAARRDLVLSPPYCPAAEVDQCPGGARHEARPRPIIREPDTPRTPNAS